MATRRRKRNLDGFLDSSGRFHPIRASSDYDPEELGFSMPKRRKKKSTAKKKRKNPGGLKLSSAWKKLPPGTKVRKVGGMVQALIPQR